MLSALIHSVHSYPAMPLAEQLVHQRYVHPGPLVLRTGLLKFPTPATDRDRTVSRRSEPSSRTTLMGEQPNPWRSEEHTSELQSRQYLVCRLLLEKKHTIASMPISTSRANTSKSALD